jgi:uncharacterized membrane protein YgdD (TMEM256/DUF423 family)
MTPMHARRVAAILGLLAVALGAFGAHGLKDVLGARGTAAIWQTAVFYHLVHAVMLWAVATREPFARAAWWGFAAGVTIFSGTLYLLAVTGIRWLGAITPLGGLALLAGWLLLALEKRPRP